MTNEMTAQGLRTRDSMLRYGFSLNNFQIGSGTHTAFCPSDTVVSRLKNIFPFVPFILQISLSGS